MKIRKLFTYKKMTRAAYLLGLVFLLTGMLLSMVSQPAAAGTSLLQATQPAIKPPPPRGPVPPVQPAPSVPSLPDNPVSPPPAPGVNGNGININNVPPAISPNLRPIQAMEVVNGRGVEFTQSNYCLDQPAAGNISAFVRVILPEGETAQLTTDWRVVHPTGLGEPNDFHYIDEGTVENGDVIEIVGWWPGNTAPGVSPGTEIHFGATLRPTEVGGQIITAGLDIYYVDGGCSKRPDLVLVAECAENGVEWTVYNPAPEQPTPMTFTYTVDGGPQQGPVTVPGATGSTPGSIMFLTTDRQSHTVTITWDDGTGGTSSRTVVSPTCAEPVPPLTLSHICSANGGVDFRVSNPGTDPVTFSYNADSDAQTGSVTVPGGAVNTVFLNLPEGSAHTVTITWPDGQDGTGTDTETSAAEECAEDVLLVAHLCVEPGVIRWTVTNPGTTAVAYTWSFDGGLVTGDGSVAGGQTATLYESSGDAHTMLVTWDDGSDSDASLPDECSVPTPPVLELSKICVDEGIQWSVTNTGETATDFTWSLDSGAETGSGSVGAGATVIVTTTAGGAHLLTVTWTEGSVSLESVAEECTEIDPPLVISKICYEDGGIQWIVTNNSAIALPFTWNLDSGANTGSSNAPANGSVVVLVSSGGVHTFSIEWLDGSSTLTSEEEECGGESVPDLSVSWICAEEDGTIQWRVSNPGIDPVTFTWSLDGSTPVSLTVPGSGSVNVTTSTSVTSHEMEIVWPDGLGGEGTATAQSEAGVCTEQVTPTPTPDLTLSYRCVDERLQWTVRNSGSQTVNFVWDLDNGSQSGTGSVPAGGSTAFLVSSNGSHTVTVSWPTPDPTRTISRISSRQACVPDIETPPVTPTPPVVFFTPTPGVLITTTPGVLVTTTPSIPVTGATPLATVGVPGSTGSGGQVLIPTTGADLTGFAFGLGALQTLFTNLGLLFLGFALVLHGLGRMR